MSKLYPRANELVSNLFHRLAAAKSGFITRQNDYALRAF